MAKKEKINKDTDPTNEGDVAETTQGETPAEVSSEPKRITTEREALELVKSSYPYLKGEQLLVTEDKNVFESKNISSGANHAERNNLKSFRVQWLD